jgi:hypothetical protein
MHIILNKVPYDIFLKNISYFVNTARSCTHDCSMLSTIHVVIRPLWEGCKILIHKQASRYGHKQLKTKMFMLICCLLTDEKLISELVISCAVTYICTMCVASYRVSGKQQPTVTICTGRTLWRATQCQILPSSSSQSDMLTLCRSTSCSALPLSNSPTTCEHHTIISTMSMNQTAVQCQHLELSGKKLKIKQATIIKC